MTGIPAANGTARLNMSADACRLPRSSIIASFYLRLSDNDRPVVIIIK
jgi:hypothetical protein